METHLSCFAIVLMQIFLLGTTNSTRDGDLSYETLPQPSTETQDDILRRLSVLEAKDSEKDDRIRLLEDEIYQLKQRSEEDRQKILQLNRAIKKEFQCKEDVKLTITDLAENESTTNQDDGAKDEADDNKEASEERQENKDWLKNRNKRLETEHQVVFFAVVTPHDVLHLGVNQPIIFDNAVVNVGNAYHPYHGIFTAPYDGIYSFTATVFGYNTGLEYFSISKGGVSHAVFETKDRQQVTQTAILDLSKGEDVSVRTLSSDRGVVGANFTTFSGFLLYEHYSSQVVG